MEHIVNERIKRYLFYIAISIVITILSYQVLKTPKMSIRIIYTLGQHTETIDYLNIDAEDTNEQSQQIQASISKLDTSERRLFDEFFQIPTNISDPSSIQFKLQARSDDEDSRIQIRTMEIQNRNITVYKYSPYDIAERFSYDKSVNDAYVEGARYCIEPEGAYASLYANDIFLKEYRESQEIQNELVFNIVFMGLIVFLILILADCIVTHEINSIKKNNRIAFKDLYQNQYQLILKLILFVAFVCSLLMALNSKFYAHPDEDVSRLAIDYYMTHWLPPNMNDVSVLGTFSDYGVSRLREMSLYYLVAGKIGWICTTIFHISKYYRMLNVILFGIMIGTFIKKKDDNLWMYIALGITPQLWYLYSYATSDAWDFFWGFWMVYQLVGRNSALQQLLEKRCTHPCRAILWNAWIFAMLFLGKQNYYLLLLFAFLVLVIKWIYAKENKMLNFCKYVIILTCTIAIMIPRTVLIPHYVNRTVESETINEHENMHNLTDTPTMGGTSRKNMGYTFLDVALKDGKDIISGLSNSGVGSYGWLEYHHSYLYGYAIVGLYGVLAIAMVYYMIKNKKTAGIIDSVTFCSMPVIVFLMVVYICWRQDFQFQGRYALPLTLIVGYYGMQEKDIYEDKKIRALLIFLGVVSACSYITKGLYNLI